MTMQLHQVTAILKSVKSRVYGDITRLHKESQKAEPFNGFAKNYRKKSEDGEDYPPESKKVVLVASDVLRRLAALMTESMDLEAQQDYANQSAKADVVVNGQVIVKDAPVTYLLFLEKQLTDVRTFIEKLPALDENRDWNVDPNSNLFKTDKVSTHKTAKVQVPIVLYAATEQHPAQTQLIVRDEIIGWWDTVHHSGAILAPRQQELLSRVDKLIRAIKVARETANGQEAPERKVGEAVFGYLLA